MIRGALRTAGSLVLRSLGLRRTGGEPGSPCLLFGDRAIEWSWIVAHLPAAPSQVLDVGCVHSALSGIAARMGHMVTAVDLNDIEYELPGVIFRKGDINELDFGAKRFDVIINCSTVEHIGLGGRYGSADYDDGDLRTMAKLREILADGGVLLLTVPVGLDATFASCHRVYGAARLPELLRGFRILREEFWVKPDGRCWVRCDREAALATAGSERYYALGLFDLSAQKVESGSK
jgi:SAM-dependent methyltransferase